MFIRANAQRFLSITISMRKKTISINYRCQLHVICISIYLNIRKYSLKKPDAFTSLDRSICMLLSSAYKYVENNKLYTHLNRVRPYSAKTNNIDDQKKSGIFSCKNNHFFYVVLRSLTFVFSFSIITFIRVLNKKYCLIVKDIYTHYASKWNEINKNRNLCK